MAVPCLKWLDEPDHSEVFLLTPDQVLIGRDAGADIVVTGPFVSRSHARIVRDAQGFSILDLKSRYGTYVNGQRIEQHPLRHGDKISLGQEGIELVYLTEDAASPDLSDRSSGYWEKSLQDLDGILPPPAEVSSELEKISCILDFHYRFGQNFSLEGTFQQILKSSLEISGAERGFILLKKADKFRYAMGLDAHGSILPQSDFRASKTVVQRVASEGQAVFMTQEIGGEFAQQASIVAMRLRAVACLPLEAISGQSDTPAIAGILYLDSTKRMHSLSGLDEKILSKLAEEAGNVLEKLEVIKNLEERKKMEQELALAEETQKNLLPRSLPQFENLQIQAFSQPTRHVGGDFYDFLHLPSGELVGVLADVSGKGISAALLSSLLQGAIAMEFSFTLQPEEVMNRLNKLVCGKTASSRFVTLFLFVLDKAGKGQFISAGHNTTYLFRAANGEIEELDSGGLILGAFDFATYEARPLQLDAGDILLVYSDGVTDAENPEGAMFGDERLRELLRQESPAGSQVLAKRLLTAVEEFTRGHAQTDDLTFVLVERPR